MPGRKPINQKKSKVKPNSKNVPLKAANALREVYSAEEQVNFKRIARDASGWLLQRAIEPIKEEDERPR
jgi:hypothetical protein